jgi:DNA-binding LacI/PurR family transcriptional regulator
MNKYNLSIREEWIHEINYNNAKNEIHKAIQKMMASRYKPTAIFSIIDFMALIALGYLSEIGFRIPEDIAVVGFDNIDLASLGFVQLTTVEQRKEEMATLAIERLMQK